MFKEIIISLFERRNPKHLSLWHTFSYFSVLLPTVGIFIMIILLYFDTAIYWKINAKRKGIL